MFKHLSSGTPGPQTLQKRKVPLFFSATTCRGNMGKDPYDTDHSIFILVM